ncbi:MAG: type II secretion system protein GspK [Candidatus Sulfobium sp.]|jgi:general secretion pathway protein K
MTFFTERTGNGQQATGGCAAREKAGSLEQRGWSAAGPEKGIALLLVLWVLTILTVIVLSFSYMARTETLSALSFRQGLQEKFLAEAGIERGITEIFYRRTNLNNPAPQQGMEVWKTDGTPYTAEMSKGKYTVSITDESGKVDINQIKDVNSDILRNLLVNLGVKKEDSDVIVDSILDWKDPDDLIHASGAESEYYESLPRPYTAKNADFDTLEELLLVKGMTPGILYGNGGKKGLIDFLTINAKTNRINALAAPKEVLEAIPGITPEIVQEIISLRENTQGQAAATSIQGLISKVPPPFSNYIGVTTGGSTFSIEAIGRTHERKTGYAIRATVLIDGNDSYRYVYYKSPSDFATGIKHDNDTGS